MPVLIFSLLIIAMVAVFSAQNAATVRINFLLWSFDASLAIVIFLSATAGALAAIITYWAFSVRRSLKRKNRTAAAT